MILGGEIDDVLCAINDLRDSDAGPQADKKSGTAGSLSSLNLSESIQLLPNYCNYNLYKLVSKIEVAQFRVAEVPKMWRNNRLEHRDTEWRKSDVESKADRLLDGKAARILNR